MENRAGGGEKVMKNNSRVDFPIGVGGGEGRYVGGRSWSNQREFLPENMNVAP